MSPYFVRQYRALIKCRLCSSKPAHLRKFCSAHLEKARLAWRTHAADCLRLGRCVDCHNKKLRNNCRCGKHREKNRLKIRIWMLAHPLYSAQGWAKRKKLLENGICVCRKHNKLPVGFRRCDECRARHRNQRKG